MENSHSTSYKKDLDKLELVTIKSVIINIVYQQEGETEW